MNHAHNSPQQGDPLAVPPQGAEADTHDEMTRRVFHRLSMAAFSGMLAGSMLGCGGGEDATQTGGTTGGTSDSGAGTGAAGDAGTDAGGAADSIWLTNEKHVCRGLNTCAGKGAGGDNDCAGQGTCALAAHHSCHGENECRGQGGCGSNPGENECRGQGGCSVPLHEGAWEAAREAFEAAMQAAGKSFGDAPPRM